MFRVILTDVTFDPLLRYELGLSSNPQLPRSQELLGSDPDIFFVAGWATLAPEVWQVPFKEGAALQRAPEDMFLTWHPGGPILWTLWRLTFHVLRVLCLWEG